MLYHKETTLRGGKIESCLTSGNYGYHLGASIGLGYVSCDGETATDMLNSTYEIEIAGERFSAIASIKPLYDQKSERVKV
jgi:4-methylaminobutanoate oxidase (formaldehyde-forming)